MRPADARLLCLHTLLAPWYLPPWLCTDHWSAAYTYISVVTSSVQPEWDDGKHASVLGYCVLTCNASNAQQQ